MNRNGLILILIWFAASGTQAQDSTKTLTAGQVMELVKRYHPVARQAGILVQKAAADLTIARGGFNPVFSYSLESKTFDGTGYYDHRNPEIRIPTWFGIEMIAGLENLSGDRTDPTDTEGKTSYAGISFPLARNLLMDKRRAALQTAKIFSMASTTEQRNMLNNLLLDAMKVYWDWVLRYQLYTILTDAVAVNEQRFELVKKGFLLGDRPAIDTTESLTQLQNFEVQRENAWMAFQQAGFELSVFFWNEKDQPVRLPPDVIPAADSLLDAIPGMNLPVLDELVETASANHPELLLYNFKLDALDVDRKLKFQELLPVISLRYNQLGKGYDIIKTATGPLLENNYRYGITVGIPLLLSEGRGAYRKARLKIEETRLDRQLKRVQVENKVKSYFNQLVSLKNQVTVQEKALQNYRALLRGEETRFRIGESSLFLVNARENRALEALQKWQELRIKYMITVNYLQWAAGILMN